MSTTLSKSSNRPAAHAASQANVSPELFSERQIAVCTFLTGPFTGGLMMAWNAVQLSRFGLAVSAVIGSAALVGLLMLVGQLVPVHLGTLLSLGVAAGFKQLALKSFEPELTSRRERQRGWASNWLAAGISLVSLTLVAAVILTLL